MSAPTFTAGPWSPDFDCFPIEILAPNASIRGMPCVVAEVPDDEFAPNEAATRADASLIAAAPDLYTALRHLAEACEVLQVPGIRTDEARAALAKAVQP